ncbi:cytochrome b [Pseudomonas sp. SDO55104_S430]
MSSSVYSPRQVVLHWLSAMVIIWTLLSGFYVAVVEVEPETKDWVAFLNVSLTSLYIPIFILRLYCSFLHDLSLPLRKRSLPEYTALCVHKAMYLVLAVVLLTGVLMMDRPINVFDILFFEAPLSDPSVTAWFMRVHIQSCVVLLILVAVHVGAVIKHELCGRRVLKNMSIQKNDRYRE